MDIRTIPTYVINLDKNSDRLKKITNHFSKLDVKIIRFPGVYGKALDKSYLEEVLHPYVWYTMQRGSIIDPELDSLGGVGCALSHIRLWEQLVNSDEEIYHILEDDAIPNASMEQLNKYVNDVQALDASWDVIYLGFNLDPITDRSHIKMSRDVHKVGGISFGAQSYLITKNGAKKLLKKAYPVIHHIDNYMSYMAVNDDFHSYRPTKSFVNQAFWFSYSSDIAQSLNLRVLINRCSTSFLVLCIVIAVFFFISMVIKGVARLSR